MTTLATIVEGNADLADLLLLIAAIVFAIVTVMYAMARSIEGALSTAGLFCVALAWLVL